jgi:hypothetical protein
MSAWLASRGQQLLACEKRWRCCAVKSSSSPTENHAAGLCVGMSACLALRGQHLLAYEKMWLCCAVKSSSMPTDKHAAGLCAGMSAWLASRGQHLLACEKGLVVLEVAVPGAGQLVRYA